MSLLVPIAAGLGLLLLLSGGKDEEAAPPGATPPSGGPPPPQPQPHVPPGGFIPKPPTPNTETPPADLYAQCFDPGIPTQFRNQAETALQQVNDPTTLDALAATLASAGFPMAAACVKSKADRLRGGGGLGGLGDLPIPQIEPPTEMGEMPYQLGYGDYPYGLANYYTGQGGRFREIGPNNPQLGTFGNGKYPNWDALASAGGTILLPASWDAWGKQLPTKGAHPYKPSGVMPA